MIPAAVAVVVVVVAAGSSRTSVPTDPPLVASGALNSGAVVLAEPAASTSTCRLPTVEATYAERAP